MYAEVNATQKQLNGNEQLSVYLSNPAAVPDVVKAKIHRAEEILGRQRLKKLVAKGHSLQVFNEAIRVLSFFDLNTDDNLVKLTDWFMTFGQQNAIRYAVRDGYITSDLLMACVNKMKPLKLSYKINATTKSLTKE